MEKLTKQQFNEVVNIIKAELKVFTERTENDAVMAMIFKMIEVKIYQSIFAIVETNGGNKNEEDVN